MDKKQLPVFGVGPIYVISCLIFTVLGLLLKDSYFLKKGNLAGLKIMAIILGLACILMGCILWIYAVLIQKISVEIKKGRLVTRGVYSMVRNPVYSAFLLVFTGIIIMAHNIYLLVLPLIFYLSLTVLLKYTEEKWLLEKFGQIYIEYCQKVNRIIPWWRHK